MDPKSRTFLTSQFKARCFGLEADKPSLLGTCQGGGQQLVYLVYRGMLCLFWTVIMFVTWADINGKYFLILTNWGVMFLCASTALELASAVYVYFKQRRETMADIEKKTPVLLKINWVMYNMASVLAVLITVVYYSVIGRELKFLDMCVHALNTVYVLVDVFITGVPVRLLHCCHTMVFLLCYVFATIFYWGVTGKALYEILDYDESPGESAIVVVILFLIGIPLLHTLLFFWYWSRVLLWERFCTKIPEDDNDSPMPAVDPRRQTRNENGPKSNNTYIYDDIEDRNQSQMDNPNTSTTNSMDNPNTSATTSGNERHKRDSDPSYATPTTTATNHNSYLDNMGKQMYGEQNLANPIYSVVDPRHSQSIPSAASLVYANVHQGADNRAYNDSMV